MLPSNIDWLKEHGVHFIPNAGAFADEKGGSFGMAGPSIMININERIKNFKYVEVLTETPGVKLIIDKNGIVKGVIGDNDGEEIKVNAKYTILATGALVDNPEMLKKYAPDLGENYRVLGPPNRTGDGITLAMQAGAKIDSTITVDTEGGHTMNLGDYSIYNRDIEMLTLHYLVKFPLLWVNGLGERFMDESIESYHLQAHSLRRNNNFYWIIFDEEIRDGLINKGYDAIGLRGLLFPALPNAKLTSLDKALERAYARGYAVKANTIEELAGKMNVDPKVFKATIERQNVLAAKDVDEDYQKDPKYLHQYKKGPFYALKAEHTIIGTLGGVQCNEKLQVIKPDLKPIPGLYITGSLIGSTVGDTYPFKAANPPLNALGGTSTGFGVSASRIIVENIKEELKK
jgi:fumarate reductase flavoprotein subunit